MKPIRCSSLQLVAVRISSNQLFAPRIVLSIASQRNGLVRIGIVWPLKGLAHAKIIKKSVILFRVLNMTI